MSSFELIRIRQLSANELAFTSDEIFWDMKFVDILAKLPEGGISIDYRLFHQITPTSEP